MKQKITVDRETARMFERLLKRGYVVDNGYATGPLMRAVRKSNLRKLFYSGYDQEMKKVVLATTQQVKRIRKRIRGFNKVQYTLQF